MSCIFKKWQCKSDRVILNSMIREGITNKLTLEQRLKEVKERAIHFSVGNRFQAEHSKCKGPESGAVLS